MYAYGMPTGIDLKRVSKTLLITTGPYLSSLVEEGLDLVT